MVHGSRHRERLKKGGAALRLKTCALHLVPFIYLMNSFTKQVFYTLKPLIPRHVQIALRRQIAKYKRKKYANVWPIDPNAGEMPPGWPGWPEGKQFALLVSHDVDSKKGQDRVWTWLRWRLSSAFVRFQFCPGTLCEPQRDQSPAEGQWLRDQRART